MYALNHDRTQKGKFWFISIRRHAIPTHPIQLLLKQRQVLRVMAHRETERLHGRRDCERTSDAVYANSISAFEIICESE